MELILKILTKIPNIFCIKKIILLLIECQKFKIFEI